MHLLLELQDIFHDVPKSRPVVTHDILVVDNATPVRQATYRISPKKIDSLRKEVMFLTDIKLAEPGDSEWTSPCVLVPKSDGSVRMCTDYCKLCCADGFPFSRINDI